jgi:hypothetical protein
MKNEKVSWGPIVSALEKWREALRRERAAEGGGDP